MARGLIEKFRENPQTDNDLNVLNGSVAAIKRWQIAGHTASSNFCRSLPRVGGCGDSEARIGRTRRYASGSA